MKKIERNIPKMSDLPSFPEINKIINKLNLTEKQIKKTLKKIFVNQHISSKLIAKCKTHFVV